MPSDFTALAEGAIVVVTGEVDMATAPALRKALASAVPEDGGLTVDLSGVRYLDSAGVAALFDYVRGGLELIVRPSSPVERVLTIAGLHDIAVVHSAEMRSRASADPGETGGRAES
jgi:anti-sigma B factor antagonist